VRVGLGLRLPGPPRGREVWAMETSPVLRPATLCVHGGRAPGELGLVPPIVRSSTFRLDEGVHAERAAGRADRSLCYGREHNPTVAAVEARLACLEGAERSLLFASGQAALHAVLLAGVQAGGRVAMQRQIYGGTQGLCRRLLPRLGVELELFDVHDLDALAQLADARLQLVLCESLSNPLTAVADLPAVARLLAARAPGARLVVDATLASPLAQRPLTLGANVVTHSATKYLGGHSDLIGGLVSGDEAFLRECWSWRTQAGGCLDPQAAYLLARGLSTLALRVPRQSETALELARFLAAHPAVERVHHCGLESDPFHAAAQRLLQHTGGLFSFVVRGGDEAARRFLSRLRLFTEAASLGGVESLISRPRDLSQVGLTEAERAAAGIAPGLVRLAVGVEDGRDLRADLEQALAG